jgi:hypothetical protein
MGQVTLEARTGKQRCRRSYRPYPDTRLTIPKDFL